MRGIDILRLGGRLSNSDKEIIRPDSTSIFNGILIGGATVHQSLSDQSDSSYIEQIHTGGKANYDQIGINGTLSNLINASGRVISSARINIRAEYTAGVIPPLRSAEILINFTSQGVLTFTPNAIATNYTSSPITKPGGGNWSEAEVNSFKYAINIIGTSGTTWVGRVYEFWLEVTYVG